MVTGRPTLRPVDKLSNPCISPSLAWLLSSSLDKWVFQYLTELPKTSVLSNTEPVWFVLLAPTKTLRSEVRYLIALSDVISAFNEKLFSL